MPPECEEIEDYGVPEKISWIDGRIKEHLRFTSPTTYCGRRAMVNKLWCQGIIRKWFHKTDESPHPRLFTEPSCQRHVATWYLFYRWLIFMAWVAIVVCSIFEFGSYTPTDPPYAKWPIYLTNWDLVLGLCQALLGGFLVSKRWKLQKAMNFDPSALTLETIDKLYWFLFVVTTNTAIVVTITYWCAIYNPAIHFMDPQNVMVHMCNSILMVLDFCIAGIPFRLRNFWWCFLIVFSYILFSVVYYLCGGLDKNGEPYIYKILDWKKPIQASVVCVGEIVFVTITHSVLCLLEHIKIRLYLKIDEKMEKSYVTEQQSCSKTQTQTHVV
ncbi:protein rolling stone isoform X1 [Xylocopa sonorina]|uniref:protein rolling stone isoform X1 n=2 Tax=Xylocopa sonorina TaxID=1818115 RepID=UPI00403A976B